MPGQRRKIIENKRRQRAIVVAHKLKAKAHQRKIRDVVKPQLREKKRGWYASTINNKLTIQQKWAKQKTNSQKKLKETQRKHRAMVTAHKRRILKIRAGL